MLLDKQCHIFDTPLLPGHFQPWTHTFLRAFHTCWDSPPQAACVAEVMLQQAESWPLSLAFRDGLDLLSHTFTMPVLLLVTQASPQNPGSKLMHIQHATFSIIKRSLEEKLASNCTANNFQGSLALQDYRAFHFSIYGFKSCQQRRTTRAARKLCRPAWKQSWAEGDRD